LSPRLIVICGLPGSGKTTLAKRLEIERSAVRLSADDWIAALSINLHDEAARGRIEALQWSICQQLLSKGLTVIVEWGSWGRWERDILRKRARELGAAVELHYLSASVDELFERIAKRAMEDPPITREMVARWAGIIDVPTTEELELFDKSQPAAL
jgi:predicted kinase